MVRYGGEDIGTVHSMDFDKRVVGVKKYKATLDIHPTHLICADFISDKSKEQAIIRFAEHVIQYGIDGGGPCRAGRDLLLKELPRTNGNLTVLSSAQAQAIDWAYKLNNGVLPIQGPREQEKVLQQQE